MERRVKERLIGAAILVVVIVIFVPQLLSGPPKNPPPPAPMALPKAPGGDADEPVRNVTVDLNNSSTSTVGTPPDSAPPAPATAAPAVVEPPQSAVAAPPPSVAPLESSAASPTSTPWSVQLGSFASRANADKLAHQLKEKGFPSYVLATGTGHTQRFKVRVSAADRLGAERVQARLKAQDYSGSLVGPGLK